MDLRTGWLVAAVVGLALVALLVAGWIRRFRARLRVQRRARRARRGEERALTLLRKAGYQVEMVQPQRRFTLLLDGEPLVIELRADLLVRRRGRRFVADVKTGRWAPRLTTAATRRQLLEYHVAYGVDGVLLIDMEQDRIRSVEFPTAAR